MRMDPDRMNLTEFSGVILCHFASLTFTERLTNQTQSTLLYLPPVIYHPEATMSNLHYIKSDTKRLFGYDLNSDVTPPVPYSISSKYKKDWKDLKTEAKKKRVRDYAEYKMSMQTAAVKLEEDATPAPTSTSSALAVTKKKVCDSEGDKPWTFSQLQEGIQGAGKLAVENRNAVRGLKQDVEKIQNKVCEMEADLAKHMRKLNIS